MSACDTCVNNTICKFEEKQAFQYLERLDASCSGYEYEKPKTIEDLKKEFIARWL